MLTYTLKEPQRKDPVDTRRGWIKEYQEEKRVEVKVGENNVLEYSYILFLARYLIIFSIDIRNHITYTIGYNRKVKMRYTYAIKEIKPTNGNDVYDTTSWDIVPETYQEIPEMSLSKLIKKLDSKKWFYVSYVNKKSNHVDKLIFKGQYKCV